MKFGVELPTDIANKVSKDERCTSRRSPRTAFFPARPPAQSLLPRTHHLSSLMTLSGFELLFSALSLSALS